MKGIGVGEKDGVDFFVAVLVFGDVALFFDFVGARRFLAELFDAFRLVVVELVVQFVVGARDQLFNLRDRFHFRFRAFEIRVEPRFDRALVGASVVFGLFDRLFVD